MHKWTYKIGETGVARIQVRINVEPRSVAVIMRTTVWGRSPQSAVSWLTVRHLKPHRAYDVLDQARRMFVNNRVLVLSARKDAVAAHLRKDSPHAATRFLDRGAARDRVRRDLVDARDRTQGARHAQTQKRRPVAASTPGD